MSQANVTSSLDSFPHADEEPMFKKPAMSADRRGSMKGLGDASDAVVPVVSTVAGVLVVGAGVALYQKIRADRGVEALEQDATDLAAQIDETVKEESKYSQLIEEEQRRNGKLKDIFEDYDPKIARVKEIEDKLRIVDGRKPVSGPERRALTDELQSIREAIGELDAKWESYEKIVAKLTDSTDTLASYGDKLKNVQQLQESLKAQLQANHIVEDILQQDLDKPLSELAYDNQIIDQNLADKIIANENVDIVEVFEEQLAERDLILSRIGTELRAQLSPSFSNRSVDQAIDYLKDSIKSTNKATFQEAVEALCTSVMLPKAGARKSLKQGRKVGLLGACTSIESIDPITSMYSEQFTIDQSAIFKSDNLYASMRESISDLGYDAEVDGIISFVQQDLFAENASSYITAYLESELGAEEAFGVLEVVGGYFGEEAFVSGLAAEVGGEALLGEFALDLLELAVLL